MAGFLDTYRRYSQDVLAGFELTRYRYAIVVSEPLVEPPQDISVAGVNYRHINIAVDPATPQAGQIRMFEITGQDIAAIEEADLRTLVALLSEAEARQRQLPTSAVTWGGNQKAEDGGLDIRVALNPGTAIDGFVPRPATGFQVKREDMSAAKITDEMRPKDTIRPSIRSLADEGGAYIIVSSQNDLSDTMLDRRRKAMRVALDGVENGKNLFTDFYDRTRLATWVRDHPGLIPWVRAKAKRPLTGWQSYGAWANPAEETSAEYLIDDVARFQTGRREDEPGLKTVEGIKRLRQILSIPGKAVRLVGLSGVGKTRLVQALFDARVGEHSLDPDWAIYTNMSDGPDPPPIAMATNLVAGSARAILVADNCPLDLHRRLQDVCKTPHSTVSIITIEYDIRDDQPEGTDVFEMEPASIEMIEELIRRRFPSVSAVNARTAAEFSGGNARVAIALAGTIEPRETISALTDEELFQRLFQQRHSPDPELLRAAQACALAYSFDGEDITSNGELARLGGVVAKDPTNLFGQVAELKRRDLVQARGRWRAVLPHAVANRLAKLALQNIPIPVIEAALIDGVPERIAKSFARRLGYLTDSPQAERIVRKLLAPGGSLNEIAGLGDAHIEMLTSVAPVAPDAVLAGFERALAGPGRGILLMKRAAFIRLLRLLAYDAALFKRSASLLEAFAQQDPEDREGEATKALTSLFLAYLSGTHATAAQRIAVMDELLRSPDQMRRRLGLSALRAMLEAGHFISHYDFQFGSRSRDFGYRPTKPQLREWYIAVFRAIEPLVLARGSIADEIREILADKFRGLWTNVDVDTELERLARAISGEGYWREGWIAIRQTLIYDGPKVKAEKKQALMRLEEELRPRNLKEKVSSIVLSRSSGKIDLDDYEEADSDPAEAYRKTERAAEKLGEEVAVDQATFSNLVPELFGRSVRLWSFGRGLASGAPHCRAMWDALVAGFTDAVEDQRTVRVLLGFLQRLDAIDNTLAGQILDEAIAHPVLGPWFPWLQCASPVDEPGCARLLKSLALGLAHVRSFECVGVGQAHASISAKNLKELAESIGAKPEGTIVALSIVFFRVFDDKDKKRTHEPEIVEAGLALLARVELTKEAANEDFQIGFVAGECLNGDLGLPAAKRLAEMLRRRAVDPADMLALDQHHDLLEGLCRAQPLVVLDVLFGGDEKERQRIARAVEWISTHKPNPLHVIPDSVLVTWCELEPQMRYVTLASVVKYLRGSEEEAASEWSDTALILIEKAPNRVAVLQWFFQRFTPSSYTGSLAAVLEGRSSLLAKLANYTDEAVATFALEAKDRLANKIAVLRKSEADEARQMDERFE